MTSIRAFCESAGFPAPVSLREVASFLEAGNPISMRALAGSGGFSDFSVMRIETQGVGDYHANRFRIYFRHPSNDVNALSATSLFSEFDRLFPQYFNGFGDEVGELLRENIATVFFRSDKPFQGNPTLAFEIDMRALGGMVDLPDVHSDWLGIVHLDATSFAVQTLKRNFLLPEDVLIETFLNTLFTLNPLIPVESLKAANRQHFLAGRRSWLIGRAVDTRGPQFEAAHPVAGPAMGLLDPRIFVLETAAIERYSSFWVQLTDVVPGLAANDIDEAIRDIWTILLRNFVEALGLVVVSPNAAFPSFTDVRRGVRFQVGEFGTLTECLSEAWVKDLVSLHKGFGTPF